MSSVSKLNKAVTIYSLDLFFSQFGTSLFFHVCRSLSCIQCSQEAGNTVWYSHLIENNPVCYDPHHKRLWHSQWSRSWFFFLIPLFFLRSSSNLISGFSTFLNPACTSGSSQFMYCWSLAWKILSITLLACEVNAIKWQFERSLSLSFFGIGMKTDLFSPVTC